MPARTATGDAVAVTAHHLATDVALEVLDTGGNAVDAAVAANAVLGVVAPETCGIGGDLFALVHAPDSPVPAALNASGRAGSNVDAQALRASGMTEIPIKSAHTITAPGCIDGWIALLDRFGTRSLATLLQPALHMAESGFAVSSELSEALARTEAVMGGQESASDLFPGGEPPQTGTALRRPLLTATLRAIIERGREGIYGGEIGEAIAHASGAALTLEDLHRQHADWISPLGLSVDDRTGWTIPPNSQGYLTLGAWWLFNELDPPTDPTDVRYHHAAIEAYRAMAWDRDQLVADPDHAPCQPAELLATPRLAARADAIHRNEPTPWPEPGPTDSGTTYLTVLDQAGLGISLIQSNFHGIGTGLSAGSSGVWMQNRGAGFTLQDGHPNELAPGKRPLHTLSPTIWTTHGRLELLLGTRGGHQQPQLLLQALAGLFHAGLSPTEAQDLARWTTSEWQPARRSRILVESGFTAAGALAAMGHDVDPEPKGRPGGWGPVSMIHIADSGIATGAADPRVSTSSAGSRNRV